MATRSGFFATVAGLLLSSCTAQPVPERDAPIGAQDSSDAAMACEDRVIQRLECRGNPFSPMFVTQESAEGPSRLAADCMGNRYDGPEDFAEFRNDGPRAVRVRLFGPRPSAFSPPRTASLRTAGPCAEASDCVGSSVGMDLTDHIVEPGQSVFVVTDRAAGSTPFGADVNFWWACEQCPESGCVPFCGDDQQQSQEECEDGNNLPGDGCEHCRGHVECRDGEDGLECVQPAANAGCSAPRLLQAGVPVRVSALAGTESTYSAACVRSGTTYVQYFGVDLPPHSSGELRAEIDGSPTFLEWSDVCEHVCFDRPVETQSAVVRLENETGAPVRRQFGITALVGIERPASGTMLTVGYVLDAPSM